MSHPKLPSRMHARPWADGVRFTYRYSPKPGKWVNLGTDYDEAMRLHREMAGCADPEPVDVSAMWRRHQKGAKQRGIEFSISEDDIRAALLRQCDVCAITRLPFKSLKPVGMRIRPWAPSIDRKNSQRGYVPGNIRVVCAFVNVAMNGFGEEMFRQVLQPLVELAVLERIAGAQTALKVSSGYLEHP